MDGSLAQFRKDSLICIKAEASIAEAQMLATNFQVHHLPVTVDDSLMGVICTCDMEAAPTEALVSEFMRDPLTLSFQHTWRDAVELMNECGIGSVVLLDDEVPRGIVTRGDLLRQQPPEELAGEIERCSCCGATSHLKLNDLGRALCQACRKLPRGVPEHLVPVRDFSPAF